MEGLFIIIAIFIGIANFAAKQKQNQAKGNRQYSPKSQSPARRENNIPESLRRTIMNVEKGWSEGPGGEVEEKPVPLFADDTEGIELEDRSSAGSLQYFEQSQSLEGICDEHPEHDRKMTKEIKAVPMVEIAENKGGILFELTEGNLLRSIVMTEVLGPPRAIKRRIR